MLNIAAIMGRLTAEPELRHTPSDIAVTRFTLAVNRSYAKEGEERKADFIDVVAWRGTTEFVCKYFSKGQMMAVNGSIQTGSYTDKDGNKRRNFEINASDVNFGGDGKKENKGASDINYNEPAPSYSSGSNADFEEVLGDDDLPF